MGTIRKSSFSFRVGFCGRKLTLNKQAKNNNKVNNNNEGNVKGKEFIFSFLVSRLSFLHLSSSSKFFIMAEKVERLSPKHPDWIWLQSPAEQLMAERSAPFDSKTDRWVADPDEVYIRA